MRFAPVEPGVDPRKQRSLIILYATFNLLACFGFFALFVAGLFSRKIRKNKVLLSFFAVFVIAAAATTIIIWTGYAFREVPFSLCVVSGALNNSITVLQTGAAIALVMKVWAHALLINHPRSDLLRTISSSNLLVALPWVASAPFFIPALIVGSQKGDHVTRASPFYCIFKLDSLNSAMQITDAIFEVGAILLSGWTAWLVARTRWRARTVRSNSSGDRSYYSLTIRTLIFNVLLAGAFAANIASGLTSFSAPIPDVVTSIITFLAVPVFGSDSTIMRILRCQPEEDTRTASHNAVSITLTQQTHMQRDGAPGAGSQSIHELSVIPRTSGLGDEWKGVELALESPKGFEDVLDDGMSSGKRKYEV